MDRIELLKRYVVSRLENELSQSICYHSIAHTLNVFSVSSDLCKMENIRSNQEELILAAALLHDLGYLYRFEDNEDLCARKVEQILPEFDYSSEEIRFISNLILATRMPQKPRNIFAKILCDADLSYLGMPCYPVVSKLLRKELEAMAGQKYSDSEWVDLQKIFLSNQRFFTKSARKLFSKGIEKNMETISGKNG